MTLFKYFNLGTKEKSRKNRFGRGSNNSKRAGRGNKGARARNRGWRLTRIQCGGQNPLYRMHGKIGFVRTKRAECTINALKLIKVIEPNEVISLQLLKDKNLIRKNAKKVKILNPGILKSLWKIEDGQNIIYSRTKKC